MLGWQITAFWLKLVDSYFCIYYYYYYYKVNFHTVIEIQVLQFTGNNIIHQRGDMLFTYQNLSIFMKTDTELNKAFISLSAHKHINSMFISLTSREIAKQANSMTTMNLVLPYPDRRIGKDMYPNTF